MVEFNYQSIPDFSSCKEIAQLNKTVSSYDKDYNIPGTIETSSRTHSKNKYLKYGHHGLMCPECYMIYEVIIGENINSKCTLHHKYKGDIIDIDILPRVDFLTVCKYCKTDVKLIEVDYNIAYSISLLNRKGYLTTFCCEGHKSSYEYSDGYISFKDNSILEYIDYLPDSWYIDLQNLREGKYIIRTDVFDKSQAMTDLFSFCKGLPNKN